MIYYQHMQRCKVCSKEFQRIGKAGTYKTCSYECGLALHKVWLDSYKDKTCKMCEKRFQVQRKNAVKRKFCDECANIAKSNAKRKENNPNWKGGIKKKRQYSLSFRRHNFACRQFRKVFVEENGYQFCEICKRSDSKIYNTHHIYYVSQQPHNEFLHHPKNLIFLCYECHEKFHKGEYKELLSKIETERGLKELFKSGKIVKTPAIFNYREDGKSLLVQDENGRFVNKNNLTNKN